jgi:hypothetical protein
VIAAVARASLVLADLVQAHGVTLRLALWAQSHKSSRLDVVLHASRPAVYEPERVVWMMRARRPTHVNEFIVHLLLNIVDEQLCESLDPQR